MDILTFCLEKTQCKGRAGQPQSGWETRGYKEPRFCPAPPCGQASQHQEPHHQSPHSRALKSQRTRSFSFRAWGLAFVPTRPRAELRTLSARARAPSCPPSAPPPFPCTGLDRLTSQQSRSGGEGPYRRSIACRPSVHEPWQIIGVVWCTAHGHGHGLRRQAATHGGGAGGRVTSDKTAREGIESDDRPCAATATPTHARQTAHARVVFRVRDRSRPAGQPSGRSREFVKPRGGCMLKLLADPADRASIASEFAAVAPARAYYVRVTLYRNLKSFQDFSSHRILRHVYEALNIDENKN